MMRSLLLKLPLAGAILAAVLLDPYFSSRDSTHFVVFPPLWQFVLTRVDALLLVAFCIAAIRRARPALQRNLLLAELALNLLLNFAFVARDGADRFLMGFLFDVFPLYVATVVARLVLIAIVATDRTR